MFVVTAWVYLSGFFKKLPAPTKDVIVPSMNIADSRAILDLADTLRDSGRNNREHNDCLRAMIFELRRINDQLEEMRHNHPAAQPIGKFHSTREPKP